MRKLAILRDNSDAPCPFGLQIPDGCISAGLVIDQLFPLTHLLQDEANEKTVNQIIQQNQELWQQRPKDERCPFANRLLGKKKNLVDCNFGENDQGMHSSPIIGSNYYQKHFSGTSVDGLYSVPLGYQQDSAIDRGTYMGPYSIDSIASNSPNNFKFQRQNMIFTSPAFVRRAQDYIYNPEIPENLDGEEVLEINESDLDSNDLQMELHLKPEDEVEEQKLEEGGIEIEGEIEVEDEEGKMVMEREFDLTLPPVPGGDNQEDIEVKDEDEMEVKDEEVEVDSDPWKWKLDTFLEWLEGMMKNIPRHSGQDTAGIERTMAYLQAVDSEISKAVRQDLRGTLNVGLIEKARDEIHKGLARLKDRLELLQSTRYGKGKKKKADEESSGLVKTAWKAGGFQVNVSLFMSALARLIINSTISAGHDMEETFKKMDKKFKLTDREKFELVQLLMDMGYPLYRDRGVLIDEDWDPTSSDNFDFAAGYMS